MTARIFFFPLGILLATARRGSSIQCQSCFAINGTCTESAIACNPVFDACGSVLIETRMAGEVVISTNKICTTRQKCTSGAIFMDLENGFRESGNSICCTTDGCNTATLTVPTRNETLNGLRCPFCHAGRNETCKEEVINCRGSETQCFTREAGDKKVTTINFVRSVSYEITQKGCTTGSFCANVADAGIVFAENLLIAGGQNIQCRAASHKAGGQKTEIPGTRTALESTGLCLQAFAGLVMTTPFYRFLF